MFDIGKRESCRYNIRMSISRDIRNLSVPDYAIAAIEAIEGAGYEAWLVGGCVRDTLLGRAVNDYDIATDAHWQDAERALLRGGLAVHRTGTKHGTVTASIDGHAIEVTTFRTDGSYADGRHPDCVSFVKSIGEDLARRDFTVNALAYHPQRGLVDQWGGITDLESGTIRAVGDPRRRFAEDGLRVLRGCRFASQLGFSFDPSTLNAMTACKMMLAHVSAERITHEMDALLLGEHVHGALMDTIDVIGAIMPEVIACKGFDQHSPYHIYDVWEHTAWVVQRAPRTRLARWVALFHDIGKPAACFFEGERAHFFGHAELSALLAQSIMERMAMSPSFVADVLTLVRMHDVQIPATSRGIRKALARLDGDVGLFEELIGIKLADALAHSEFGSERVELARDLKRALEEVLQADEAFTVAQLAINGHDVMRVGVPAGPEVGRALRFALDAVMDGRIANERGALLAAIESRPCE